MLMPPSPSSGGSIESATIQNSPNTSAAATLLCAGCGYDLRGSPGERCPECGLVIDRSGAGESRIAWMHRRRIGRVRAFWKTVAFASGRPQKFAAEVARPVRFRDAVVFRRIVALLAFVPMAALLVFAYVKLYDAKTGIRWLDVPRWPDNMSIWDAGTPGELVAEGVTLASLLSGLWLFLLGAAGMPSYFCHPRSLPIVQQNRAIAVSYYACAPLATWPAMALLLCIAEAIRRATETNIRGPHNAAFIVMAFAIFGTVTTILLAWWNAGTIAARATNRGSLTAWNVRLLLPVMWALLAGLCLVAVPAIVAWLCLVVLSVT